MSRKSHPLDAPAQPAGGEVMFIAGLIVGMFVGAVGALVLLAMEDE